jgi:outer membrane protein assembly factor BamB
VPQNPVAMPAFDGGAADSGVMSAETLISTQTVSHLSCLWRGTLPGTVDGTFVEQPSVATPAGMRTLLFATTTSGTIFALDAYTGQLIWQRTHPAGSCRINNGIAACYTTSSPALDPSGHYVYSYGLDGRVHKHDTATGDEVTGNGWPETVTLKSFDEKGSAALNIANGYLYVANGGYPGDHGDYQGHVTAIALATGQQTVFNTACSDQTVHFVERPGTPDCPHVQSAIWSRPGVTVDPETGDVFFATGNGDYDPGSLDWGDSTIELPANLSVPNGMPLDTYTPTDQGYLNGSDLDLGSTAPVLLPQQSGSSTPSLVMQVGKDGILRLLNRQNLSSQGGPGHEGGEVSTAAVPQGGEVLPQPAIWQDSTGMTWIFVADAQGVAAMRVVTDSAGHTTLATAYVIHTGGTSPLVADGVLFVQSDGDIDAYNAATGALLWHASVEGVHWQSPLVANGEVVVGDDGGHIQAFALAASHA